MTIVVDYDMSLALWVAGGLESARQSRLSEPDPLPTPVPPTQR